MRASCVALLGGAKAAIRGAAMHFGAGARTGSRDVGLIGLPAGPLAGCPVVVYDPYMVHIFEGSMGIVNIDDDLHDQIRKASAVACRSINAQAAFWIKIGLLCETNPTLSFNQVVTRELRAAGVETQALRAAAT